MYNSEKFIYTMLGIILRGDYLLWIAFRFRTSPSQ